MGTTKIKQKVVQPPDLAVMEMFTEMGKYVTYLMVAVIAASIIYFSSCKFHATWKLLEGDLQSIWKVGLFSFAYCLITDGSRIALLLYGLRDFALGKSGSGTFGVILSFALTGFAVYESEHIAHSVLGNEAKNGGYYFIYAGFVVANGLAWLLELRMVMSTTGMFKQVYGMNETEDDEKEDNIAGMQETYNENEQTTQHQRFTTPTPYPFSLNTNAPTT